MTRIVVGVDGSTSSKAALAWALAEAELHGWSVTAVMAWSFLDQRHISAGDRFDPRYDERSAEDALRTHVAEAIGPTAAARVEQRAVCDLPAAALLDQAKRAGLLVVGARGLGGFRGLLLGSVSQQCLEHAPCPVAVVRGGPPERRDGRPRIVVGIDGSPTAQRALRWAIEEARRLASTLQVVHAWQMPALGASLYSATGLHAGAVEDAAARVLADAIEAEDTTGLAEPVERVLRCGSPATTLLETAKGADLVVVGSRGLGGFTGLLLGSVSHQLARHVECPLVVVPADR